MFSIRKDVFETNSSSTHSLTLCTQDEYDKWVAGEYVYDRTEEELIPIEKATGAQWKYLTEEEYWNEHEYSEITFRHDKTTPGGEKVVAFGYGGYDG